MGGGSWVAESSCPRRTTISPYRNLLAKSWDPKESPTPPAHARLLPHLRAAEVAADSIVNACGETLLANLELNAEIWISRLRLTLTLAALIHDLGKASSYFQGMVRGKPDFPPTAQPIRHELLTVLILLRNSGGVADWLRGRFEEAGQGEAAAELFQTVLGAVAGHHVKMSDDWVKAFPAQNQGGGGNAVDLYLGHADLHPLFGAARPSRDESWSLLNGEPTYPGKSQYSFNMRSADWLDYLRSAPEWRRFAAVVKALTVASDVAGSALLPEGVAIASWIGEALSRRATAQQLHDVALVRLNGRPARPFQQAIAASLARVTLVEAGCGSGKTAAAYLWAANRANGRKLFFCYPTTGTATEGFLDYVAESEVEAALIHSRATVDLERVAGSQEQEGGEEQLRVTSLNTWAPEAVICTIDTVLALPRNNRRGLYGSPAILCGCFVFDELHAYDDEMFAAVVALILAMPGAPFLLMSASLPAHRKAFLHKWLGDIGTVAPPAELEAIPRYRIQRAESTDAFEQAAERVREGGRVLWVCNVVARAQALFDQARAAGLPVVAYHSRFRYEDRVERHRDVVDRFGGAPGRGLLAVTTQVAEMSLDLDADLLVTELAPVPSLIQRLGRLNRRVSEVNPGTPRLALVVMPEKNLPYGKEDLAVAGVWLDRLAALARPLSQHDLAEQFRELADEEPPRLELRMAWLDSGWCATPQSVREPGFSINVILAADANACRADSRELIKRSLPMPYNSRMDTWPNLRGALIAPPDAIHYDEHKGATWAD